MLGFLILIYFLLASTMIWMVLFPEGRAVASAWRRSAAQAWRNTARSLFNWPTRIGKTLGLGSRQMQAQTGLTGKWLFRHRWLLIGSSTLLIVPPMAVLLFSSGSYLEGFSNEQAPVNAQVAALLAGEQLVPPAPLPPDIFMSAEVEQLRPMLPSASRNWQLLNSDFAQRVLLVFKIMREQHGYEMTILEGYRSPERQDMLARMGAQVTNAKAFQSYHQYGLAVDSAFVRDGKLVISERDPWAMRGYELYGQVAESAGLHWGGRWKMLDLGHAELRLPGTIK